MRRLAKVCLQLLAVLGAIVGFGTAHANEHYSRTIECSTCVTAYDFKQAAVSDSLSLQWNVTYTVVGSSSNARSAFVRVHGNWWPDPWGGPDIWYPTGTVVTEHGAPISTNASTAGAQLQAIDQSIFGFTRTAQAPSVTTIRISDTYTSSFINSQVEFESPGINNAIVALGRLPSSFPVGYKLTVVYQDGSRAIFVKISATGSFQWAWDGTNAWNAQGKPITDRSGTLKTNGATAGGASGSSTYITQAVQPYTGLDVGWHVFFWGQGHCVDKTTVSTQSDGILFTYERYVPCG